MATEKATGRMEMARVVCESCGHRYLAPSSAVWPVSCPKCTCDAAPGWWFRENNPDSKAVYGLRGAK